MKNKYIILALALITLSPCAKASGTKTVDLAVPAYRYNEMLKKEYPDTLSVYVDDDGDYYIKCGRARIAMERSTLGALIASAQKAIEWSNKARQNHITTEKQLPQVAGLENIVFASQNEGKNCGMLLYGTDFDNQFIKMEVAIASSNIPAFIEALSKVDETTRALRNENNRASDVLR